MYKAVGGKLSDSDTQARNVLIFIVITNIVISPLTATLNMLSMIAVKTKRRLRKHKSNILLACLAVTDFAVGVIVQPINCRFNHRPGWRNNERIVFITDFYTIYDESSS